MGAAVMFFLAKSAIEFNKMTALRSEMEMMVKYVKGEIQRKTVASSFADLKVNSLPSLNYWRESLNKTLCLPDETKSCNLMGTYAMVSNRQYNWLIDLDNRIFLKDNGLQQELQVELKRFQLNLEGLNSSLQPHQYRNEVGSESLNETLQEVNQPKEEEPNKRCGCGVCPRELERRLQELLKARQQEWIAELETECKCTERKLHDKETEICWWGETLHGWSQSIEKTSFICSSKRDAVASSSLKTCI